MRRNPNLFVIGAMKAGTSALHAYLGTHPEIFMSEPKEPSHFVDAATLRRIWPTMAHRGYTNEEAYLALFEGAGDAPVIGESSTNYAKRPQISGVPERIAAFNPEARFIYVMRDPLRRAISHYWHLVRSQRERRHPLAALREDPQYVDVSDYAMQLEPYLVLFGRERIRLVISEELDQDPGRVVREVFAWLGVDPGFVPPNLAERVGVTPPSYRERRTAPLVRRLHRSRLWHILAPKVPSMMKAGARRALYHERQVTLERAGEQCAIAYLRPILQARTEALEDLLGERLALWTLLYDTSAAASETAATIREHRETVS